MFTVTFDRFPMVEPYHQQSSHPDFRGRNVHGGFLCVIQALLRSLPAVISDGIPCPPKLLELKDLHHERTEATSLGASESQLSLEAGTTLLGLSARHQPREPLDPHAFLLSEHLYLNLAEHSQ